MDAHGAPTALEGRRFATARTGLNLALTVAWLLDLSTLVLWADASASGPQPGQDTTLETGMKPYAAH